MKERDHVWILWEWSEDSYLVEDFQHRAIQHGLRLRAFSPEHFRDLDVQAFGQYPHLLWDRAGDVYPEARRLADWAEAYGSRVVNPVRGALLIHDKALLHQLLLKYDLPLPSTHLIRDVSDSADLDWGCGRYLVLKPAISGGGEGVMMREWDQAALRQEMHHRAGETWLLQEHIEPAVVSGRRAWFRVFYLFGDIRVCWWDNRTHFYEFLPCHEVERLGFDELKALIRRLGNLFPLQFFSTEVAYRSDGKPVIVDYINDPCDLRSRARIPNGVPEELLDWIFDAVFRAARGESSLLSA